MLSLLAIATPGLSIGSNLCVPDVSLRGTNGEPFATAAKLRDSQSETFEFQGIANRSATAVDSGRILSAYAHLSLIVGPTQRI